MRRSLWFVLAGTAALAAWSYRTTPATALLAAAPVLPVSTAPGIRQAGAFGAWPELEVVPALGDPFASTPPAPPAALRYQLAAPSAAEPPPPSAPALAHRFFGRVVGPDGQLLTLLTRTGEPVAISDGMTLDDGYVVEAVRADAVRLVYPALGSVVELPLPPPPSEAR
jgi:hypothetical protein